MRSTVPAVMFHGVSPEVPERPAQYAGWPDPALFERYLEFLSRDGFRSVFLDEVRRYKKGSLDLPQRSIALTFDDGYLDFWLYVFPLLRKYDIKATVFVSTDFVDREGGIRDLSRDSPYGFLSWDEMRKMEASGLVDVQSHAKTHDWYATGSRLLDAHRPDLPWRLFRFIWWNRFPSRKPSWFQSARPEDLPYGLPILEHQKSLLARRFSLTPGVETELVDRVAGEGGASFFSRPNWFDVYGEWYSRALGRAGSQAGEYETNEQRSRRLEDELHGSRVTLGAQLGKEVRYLCCPGGAVDEHVLALAGDYGYQGVIIPPRMRRNGEGNRRGEDPARIHRMTTGSVFRRTDSLGSRALSFRWRVRAVVGLAPYRSGWFGLRVLRKLKLI